MRPRFVFVACDAGGLDLWRTHWPAQGLMALGEDVTVLGVGSKTRDVPLEPRDVVVIHVSNAAKRYIRGKEVYGVEWMVEYCLRSGGSVLVNLDDDYTRMRDIQDITATNYTLFITDLIAGIRRASGVVVSTPRLAEVYGRWARRIGVGRNYFPARLFAQRFPKLRTHDVVFMGRVAPHGSFRMPHADDVTEVAQAFAGLDVWTIGDPGDLRRLLPDAARVSGLRSLGQETLGKGRNLYAEIGRARVGIAPLRVSEFCRAKSWIKPVEYAISGTPSVFPAWHPEFSALSFPAFRYDSPEGARRELDHVLGLSEAEAASLRASVQSEARRYTLEATGAREWQRLLRQMA